ncbi:MAG: ABC transporter permease [Clostridia bacterium]|nr:ABC transporter permease [Clostridia bacterium]
MSNTKTKKGFERNLKKNSMGATFLNIPYILWAAIFIIVPMFIVAYYAFTNNAGEFTLDNFNKLSLYRDSIIDSFVYALVATVVTLVLAYPFSYFVARSSETVQKIIMMLVMLPMWMNLLIMTYSIMNIIETNGIINSLLVSMGFDKLKIINTPGAVIFGMVYNYFPYMVLPLVSVLSKIDDSLLEASADLGSNAASRFWRVILPLSVPGVISGFTMVFVPSVSTFYISQKLGGTNVNMIGDSIEALVKSVNTIHLGAMLSLVLMVVILICIMVMNRFSDDSDGGIVL